MAKAPVERNRIEDQIAQLAEQFARDVMSVIGSARMDELLGMSRPSQLLPAVGAVGASQSAVSRRFAPATSVTAPAVKRKRNWPNCGEVGCTNSYYPASGTARLCYHHFIASGGRHPSKRDG